MAVEGNVEDMEKLLAEANKACHEDGRATIACFNGPRISRLLIQPGSIEDVSEIVTQHPAFCSSMKTKKLNVTNTFHSTLAELSSQI